MMWQSILLSTTGLLLFLTGHTTACGGFIDFSDNREYLLLSPGFPLAPYSDDQSCEWNVTVPLYHGVHFEIQSVTLKGTPSPPNCADSDSVKIFSPALTRNTPICSTSQTVATRDSAWFIVKFEPRGLAAAVGENYGFSIKLRAVPFFDLNCGSNYFHMEMQRKYLQSALAYPYQGYHLNNPGCTANVDSASLRFSGAYEACDFYADEDRKLDNTVHIEPVSAGRDPVKLPLICQLPVDGLIVSTTYEPAAMLPVWGRRDYVVHRAIRNVRSNNPLIMAPVSSALQLNVSLNVFNNDEFHPDGLPSMWRPSDLFFEVEALNAPPQLAFAAEECWYTANPNHDDQDRHTFLYGGCPAIEDPIERFPSSPHKDRFAATIRNSFDGADLQHAHCRVKICNVDGSGCEKVCVDPPIPPATTTPDPLSHGSLSGVVKDAVSSHELDHVTARVKQDWREIGLAISTASGQYSIQDLPVFAGYTVVFQRFGYHTAVMEGVEIVGGEVTILEALMFINETIVGAGVASGTVTNALTGSRESGVLLHFREGINAQSGSIVASISADGNGNWEIGWLNTGHYTMTMSKLGFITSTITVLVIGGSRRDNQNGAISPAVASDQTRIILTWGEVPRDLDSHLTGPTANGSRFHVWFGGKEQVVANLDLDDTSSFGPETTTIVTPLSGIYRFSVHDFTNGGSLFSIALANSQASVRVIFGGASTPAHTFYVPNQPGTLWTVFELTDGILRPVNTMSYNTNAALVP